MRSGGEADLVAELLEEVGDRGRRAHAFRAVAVQALEEFRGAQRRADLPPDPRRTLAGHLVERADRHLERLWGLIKSLLAGDHRADGALENLEALGLAWMKVLRRQGGGARIRGLHVEGLAVGLGTRPQEAKPKAVGPLYLLTGTRHSGVEATSGPRSIRCVRRALAVLFSVAALVGCGSSGGDATPTACLDSAPAYLSALRAAPGEVRLHPDTAISECFGETQGAGELANVGQTVIRVATQLNAQARRDPGGRETVMLGYLAGAVHEGASHAAGADADLVRRLDAAARFTPGGGTLGAAFERAFGKGYAAGEQTG